MYELTWITARIVGHPDGDIWVDISADHFGSTAGAPDTVAAAEMLIRQALPDGGLISEYLFREQLERVALAAEIAAMQAHRDWLFGSTPGYDVPAARAGLKAARYRYVSDTTAALERLRSAHSTARVAPGGLAFGHGDAFKAMQLAQSQHADASMPLTMPWWVASL